MSLSLSRLERHNPPPRKKSCIGCIKAKRRCNRDFPTCIRCSQRKITCEYPSRPPQRTAPRSDVIALAAVEEPTTIYDFSAGNITGHDLLTENLPINGFDPAWTSDEVAHHIGKGPQKGLFKSVGGPGLQSPRMDIPEFISDLNNDSTIEYNSVDDFDFTIGLPLGDVTSAPMDIIARPPLHIVSHMQFDAEAVNEGLDNKLSYTVETIKAAPRTMLLENQTPWCHASLYKEEMPRVMQDALSACALYASKNNINGPVIMRCINGKVNDLLGSPVPTGRLEALARTQAIMLYQIIRFFDGDVVARSSADSTFCELDTSSTSLYRYLAWDTDDTESNDLGCGNDKLEPLFPPLQKISQFWREWVFRESARRTYLIARFFINVWRFLTGRGSTSCSHDPPLNMWERWTLSAHLWNAQDAFDFAVAWRGKKHYVVQRKAVMVTLADAKGDDVDTFGKMILTAAMGISDAKIWLASIGSSL